MASFIRGLGLVLTVSLAATHPAAIRTESPDSVPWWETKDFTQLIETAQARRAAEDFPGLESVYVQGLERARALRNQAAQISYLSNLGTARMLSLRYAPALQAYLEASDLAEQAGDWSALGAIAVNLALIYQRVGDADSALSALERGKTALDRLRTSPFYKAQLLMRLRDVRAALQENPTEPRYEDAIEAARQSGDPDAAAAEAAAWDLLGKEKIAAGALEEAEAALGAALRLRTSHSLKNLYLSYAALGALRLAQADRAAGEERQRRAKEAEVFTDRAMASGPTGPPNYVLVHQRGRIREVLGQTDLALQDFSATVDQATMWNVPAALSLVTGANAAMQHEIFESFVETAARQALRTNNRKLAADAFMALEANRATSLRESRDLAPVWKKKLPGEYWETQARLRRAEALSFGTNSTASPEAKRLRLELTEMESTAGIGVSVMLAENFRSRSSLIHLQQGLSESDLLLSFYLGRRESYLWTVTRSRIELHRLPAEAEVREDARRFREAIVSDASAGVKLGADLYQRLFGSLDAAEAAKTSWLLSLDGALFDLPFAALVTRLQNGRPAYLAEQHSSQRIPGALFLTHGSTAAQGGYLAVGDPVYNSADPRATTNAPSEVPGQLNRLVNSAREIRRSALNWGTGTGLAQPIEILEGTAAQRDVFLDRLNAVPSTIHLATHVLAPAGRSPTSAPEQVFLAFALDASGHPGLLSSSEIGLLHVPGALIVMTGCATSASQARAGAGLLGLTRAWMMAGARAVVATNWPVADADGDLIPGFYQYLGSNSTAEALRRSQLELIRSGTWQASPSYWAAFQVAGGGR